MKDCRWQRAHYPRAEGLQTRTREANLVSVPAPAARRGQDSVPVPVTHGHSKPVGTPVPASICRTGAVVRASAAIDPQAAAALLVVAASLGWSVSRTRSHPAASLFFPARTTTVGGCDGCRSRVLGRRARASWRQHSGLAATAGSVSTSGRGSWWLRHSTAPLRERFGV
jgi:hypothetical protein